MATQEERLGVKARGFVVIQAPAASAARREDKPGGGLRVLAAGLTMGLDMRPSLV
jgi:hypothetical protein